MNEAKYISVLLSIYKKEYDKTKEYLLLFEEMTKKVAQNGSSIDSDNHLIEYEPNHESNLSEIIELLKHFNTRAFDQFGIVNMDIINNPEPNSCVEFFNRFIYKRTNLSIYNNVKGKCIISGVLNGEGGYFFMVMISQKDNEFLAMGCLNSEEIISFYNCIPKPNEIFGIYHKKVYLRAIREKDFTGDIIKVFLLDVGTIIDLDLEKQNCFQLTERARKKPAEAFVCQIAKVNGNKPMNAEEFLNKNLSTTWNFKTVHILNNVLIVELTDIVPFSNVKFNNYQFHSTNPFVNDINQLDIDPELNDFNHISKDIRIAFNDNNIFPLFCKNEKLTNCPLMEEQVIHNPEPNEKTVNTIMPEKEQYSLTSKTEMDQLIDINREKYNINEMKPNHQSPIISIKARLKYPKIYSYITLLPTHITDVKTFYAQIKWQGNIHAQNNPCHRTLNELHLEMNSRENVGAFKYITREPCKEELVLALYTDKCWYRARIINVMEKLVKVFYVDYGNCSVIPINDIRQWKSCFDYLPFQAVKCYLHNISIIRPYHMEAIEIAKKHILYKQLTAHILDITDGLSVNLYDENDYDIGNMLCITKMALKKKGLEDLHQK